MCVLASACSSGSYHCGKKVWNVLEGETMEVLKEETRCHLETIAMPLMEKLYLIHDLAGFNISSLLVLYDQI